MRSSYCFKEAVLEIRRLLVIEAMLELGELAGIVLFWCGLFWN